ncbi:MAG: cytochrome-c peroxidase [Polyangiaceae bacterium]|nr:cytochrome-c peroxidase [Polyangiaceae bacterium]
MKPNDVRFALPTLLLGASLVGASLTALSCSDSSDDTGSNNNDLNNADASTSDSGDNNTNPVSIDPTRLLSFAPLPKVMWPAEGDSNNRLLFQKKVDLGKQLYFDTRLSKNNDISCNSCHLLDQYGVDGQPVSDGTNADKTATPPHGNRNAPTVYNAALHLWQFWDGRAEDVEAQALGPILNPVEMGMKDEQEVLAVINSIDGYVTEFAAAFPPEDLNATGKDPNENTTPVSYINIGKAIGAFERTLVTPSRWDAYLNGDKNALTAAELAGLAKFMEVGCDTCHNGVAMGGRGFDLLGETNAWPWPGHPNADGYEEIGRADVTNDDADKYVFKVPSLRNVEKTGPYFHDGSVTTLEEAVNKMAYYQLGKTLSSDDVASIVTFLKALTGDLDDATITKPTPLPGKDDGGGTTL